MLECHFFLSERKIEMWTQVINPIQSLHKTGSMKILCLSFKMDLRRIIKN